MNRQNPTSTSHTIKKYSYHWRLIFRKFAIAAPSWYYAYSKYTNGLKKW